jgi:hypothetical protein
MIPEGNPTQSLGGRDAELAVFVRDLIEDPSRIDKLSATQIKETSLFCFGRLQAFRMGGRSAPLVGLSVLLWRAKPEHLRFLNVDWALNIAFAIATDPSYIWPEWGVVLAGVLISKCTSLLPETTDEERVMKTELLAQAELRLIHLAGERPPTAGPSVRVTAESLIAEWKQKFLNGLQPIVEASQADWPTLVPRSTMSDTALQGEIERLDRIMPAWYDDEDRRLYRLSMERKDVWLIGKVHLMDRSRDGD